jgi:hypothetical protein
MPDGAQPPAVRHLPAQHCVYTTALALQKEHHDAGHKCIGDVVMAPQLSTGQMTQWHRYAEAHGGVRSSLRCFLAGLAEG